MATDIKPNQVYEFEGAAVAMARVASHSDPNEVDLWKLIVMHPETGIDTGEVVYLWGESIRARGKLLGARPVPPGQPTYAAQVEALPRLDNGSENQLLNYAAVLALAQAADNEIARLRIRLEEALDRGWTK
jgi:hypothetical protein